MNNPPYPPQPETPKLKSVGREIIILSIVNYVGVWLMLAAHVIVMDDGYPEGWLGVVAFVALSVGVFISLMSMFIMAERRRTDYHRYNFLLGLASKPCDCTVKPGQVIRITRLDDNGNPVGEPIYDRARSRRTDGGLRDGLFERFDVGCR